MSVGRALRELMRDPYRRGEAVLQSSGAHLLLESGDLEVALRSERVAIISCWMKTPRVSRSLSTYIERLSQIGFSSVLINTSEFRQSLGLGTRAAHNNSRIQTPECWLRLWFLVCGAGVYP